MVTCFRNRATHLVPPPCSTRVFSSCISHTAVCLLLLDRQLPVIEIFSHPPGAGGKKCFRQPHSLELFKRRNRGLFEKSHMKFKVCLPRPREERSCYPKLMVNLHIRGWGCANRVPQPLGRGRFPGWHRRIITESACYHGQRRCLTVASCCQAVKPSPVTPCENVSLTRKGNKTLRLKFYHLDSCNYNKFSASVFSS